MNVNFKKDVYALIKEVSAFDYQLDGLDRRWEVVFQDDKKKWHFVRILKYQDTHYISLVDGELCGLEVASRTIEAMQSFAPSYRDRGSDNIEKAWGGLIFSMRKWLQLTQKDWIKVNKHVYTNYPLNRRFGIVLHALVREILPDFYRLDKELGKAKTKKFLQIVESNYFRDQKKTSRDTMAAKDFFEYCKIAYIEGQRKDDSIDEVLSGREMYKRYADGRDEGLLEVNMNSKDEFTKWVDHEHPKRTSGGHPWEIKRGGNTTHIDLYVVRPEYYLKEGFKVELNGPSIGRLAETINMFLGIYEKKLPISIADPEGIRKRLLAQDNIGIVPNFDSLHRANQNFPEHQNVYDVLYFDDLGKSKRRILPFVTWDPLPLLRPANTGNS